MKFDPSYWVSVKRGGKECMFTFLLRSYDNSAVTFHRTTPPNQHVHESTSSVCTKYKFNVTY